ncbi:MAG: arsenate reductase [Bacteroidetes bacterium]|nr:MAG: arsenate reductase [Bacteroidota bacterium]
MSLLRIYHNPRCKKSRAGLALLTENAPAFEIVDYFKQPFTHETLAALIQKSGSTARDFIRTQEDDFKLHYKGKDLNEKDWIDAIVSNPKLLKRPVVETDDGAVWADPPEKLLTLLHKKQLES